MGHTRRSYARIGFRSLALWRYLITGSRNRADCGKARISLRKVKDEVYVYKYIHHGSGWVFARVAERIEDQVRDDVSRWLRWLINIVEHPMARGIESDGFRRSEYCAFSSRTSTLW
jgi:hypothetical protein